MSVSGIKAVLFDVFGTVVDWRGTMLNEIDALKREKNTPLEAETFIDTWRAAYREGMADIRAGNVERQTNRMVYRVALEKLLQQHAVTNITEDEKDHLSRIDHRYQPWPDSIPGLTRLKQKFIIGTLSNGTSVALVNMAKNVGLPWDVIFAADMLGAHKPAPEAYLKAAKLLDLKLGQIMLAAAHNQDLKGAAAAGFKTGFICRPTEYGPDQAKDTQADGPWDVVSDSIEELAAALGA